MRGKKHHLFLIQFLKLIMRSAPFDFICKLMPKGSSEDAEDNKQLSQPLQWEARHLHVVYSGNGHFLASGSG